MKISVLFSLFAAIIPAYSMATNDDSLDWDWAGTFVDPLAPVGATECDTSIMSTYANLTVGSLSPDALQGLFELEGKYKISRMLLPIVALGEPESDKPNAFPDGLGRKLLKTLDDLKKFWNSSDDVFLRSLNANILLDAEGLKKAYMDVRGWDSDRAEAAASRIQEIVADFPELGPSFPYWTMNSFAWTPRVGKSNGNGIAVGGKGDAAIFVMVPCAIVSPTSLLFLDGLLSFYKWLHISETAPFFLVAHEYSHQLQAFASNGPDETSPEASRYKEMEADALAVYYMYHPRGSTCRHWRIMQAVEAAAVGGDCAFDSKTHHGTPSQRLDSAEFAIQTIDDSKCKRKKLSFIDFRTRFHSVFAQL
eukprot:scaffold25425_cov152-Cylindrotheca_fusiformis.AAC.1